MNDPELDRFIKEKMRQYVPDRRIQVLHGGVIVLVSIAIGILTLPAGQGLGAWLGVYLAVGGLILYAVWTHLRANKARKEANEEYLAASRNK